MRSNATAWRHALLAVLLSLNALVVAGEAQCGNASAAVGICGCVGLTNSSTAPHILVRAGLRPSLPLLATLAREHSARALQPNPDERLAVVDVHARAGKGPGSSGGGSSSGLQEELAELLQDVGWAAAAAAAAGGTNVDGSQQGSGAAGASTWAGAALDDSWALDAALAPTAQTPLPAAAARRQAIGLESSTHAAGRQEQAPAAGASARRSAAEAVGAAGTGSGGGTAATVPAGWGWSSRVLGTAEYAVRPLLRSHAAGNTSWLQQLNASAAAGAELPAELLTPRLGSADGPAAAPLLLLYRRDWWQRLVATGGVGSNSTGSNGPDATAAEQLLPPTWDLLVQLLSALRNSDLDGDDKADHVLCADLQPGCKGWALLAAVYASLAQTHGTQQGIWFNATDLSPAVGGPAMQAALQTYAALAASNAAPFTPGGAAVSLSNVSVSTEELLRGGGGELPTDGSAPACGAVNPLFAAGRCLFTIDWATAVLRLTRAHTQGMSGQLGVAPLPGSAYVVPADTASSKQAGGAAASSSALLPCNASLCPHAAAMPDAALQLVTALTAPPSGSASPGPPQPQPQPAQPPPLVNRAPLLGEASNVWVLAAWQAADDLIRLDDYAGLVAYQLGLKYASLLQPLRRPSGNNSTSSSGSGTANSGGASGGTGLAALTISLEADAVVAAGPSGLAPGPAGGSQLVALDLEAEDVAAALRAVDACLRHPNAAVDVQLPFSSQYRLALDDLAAAWLAQSSAAAAVPAATASGSSRALAQAAGSGSGGTDVLLEVVVEAFANVTNAFPYPAILLRLYWQATGFTPRSRAGDSGSSSSDRAMVVPLAASLGAVGGAVVVCAAVTALLLWRRRDWRRRQAAELQQGKGLQPPGPGPATTLAVTDVQNSTLLWEVLSAELMDECLATHHRIMREAIELYCGYEVFTEGDSFAVAFHGPDDGVGFALYVQMALLEADWPAELLEQPDGCEVWARRNTHLLQPPPHLHLAPLLAPTGTPAPGSPSVTAGLHTGGGGGRGHSRAPSASGYENPFAARLTAGSKRLRQLLTGAASRSHSYLVPSSAPGTGLGLGFGGSPRAGGSAFFSPVASMLLLDGSGAGGSGHSSTAAGAAAPPAAAEAAAALAAGRPPLPGPFGSSRLARQQRNSYSDYWPTQAAHGLGSPRLATHTGAAAGAAGGAAVVLGGGGWPDGGGGGISASGGAWGNAGAGGGAGQMGRVWSRAHTARRSFDVGASSLHEAAGGLEWQSRRNGSPAHGSARLLSEAGLGLGLEQAGRHRSASTQALPNLAHGWRGLLAAADAQAAAAAGTGDGNNGGGTRAGPVALDSPAASVAVRSYRPHGAVSSPARAGWPGSGASAHSAIAAPAFPPGGAASASHLLTTNALAPARPGPLVPFGRSVSFGHYDGDGSGASEVVIHNDLFEGREGELEAGQPGETCAAACEDAALPARRGACSMAVRGAGRPSVVMEACEEEGGAADAAGAGAGAGANAPAALPGTAAGKSWVGRKGALVGDRRGSGSWRQVVQRVMSPVLLAAGASARSIGSPSSSRSLGSEAAAAPAQQQKQQLQQQYPVSAGGSAAEAGAAAPGLLARQQRQGPSQGAGGTTVQGAGAGSMGSGGGGTGGSSYSMPLPPQMLLPSLSHAAAAAGILAPGGPGARTHLANPNPVGYVRTPLSRTSTLDTPRPGGAGAGAGVGSAGQQLPPSGSLLRTGSSGAWGGGIMVSGGAGGVSGSRWAHGGMLHSGSLGTFGGGAPGAASGGAAGMGGSSSLGSFGPQYVHRAPYAGAPAGVPPRPRPLHALQAPTSAPGFGLNSLERAGNPVSSMGRGGSLEPPLQAVSGPDGGGGSSGQVSSLNTPSSPGAVEYSAQAAPGASGLLLPPWHDPRHRGGGGSSSALLHHQQKLQQQHRSVRSGADGSVGLVSSERDSPGSIGCYIGVSSAAGLSPGGADGGCNSTSQLLMCSSAGSSARVTPSWGLVMGPAAAGNGLVAAATAAADHSHSSSSALVLLGPSATRLLSGDLGSVLEGNEGEAGDGGGGAEPRNERLVSPAAMASAPAPSAIAAGAAGTGAAGAVARAPGGGNTGAAPAAACPSPIHGVLVEEARSEVEGSMARIGYASPGEVTAELSASSEQALSEGAFEVSLRRQPWRQGSGSNSNTASTNNSTRYPASSMHSPPPGQLQVHMQTPGSEDTVVAAIASAGPAGEEAAHGDADSQFSLGRGLRLNLRALVEQAEAEQAAAADGGGAGQQARTSSDGGGAGGGSGSGALAADGADTPHLTTVPAWSRLMAGGADLDADEAAAVWKGAAEEAVGEAPAQSPHTAAPSATAVAEINVGEMAVKAPYKPGPAAAAAAAAVEVQVQALGPAASAPASPTVPGERSPSLPGLPPPPPPGLVNALRLSTAAAPQPQPQPQPQLLQRSRLSSAGGRADARSGGHAAGSVPARMSLPDQAVQVPQRHSGARMPPQLRRSSSSLESSLSARQLLAAQAAAAAAAAAATAAAATAAAADAAPSPPPSRQSATGGQTRAVLRVSPKGAAYSAVQSASASPAGSPSRQRAAGLPPPAPITSQRAADPGVLPEPQPVELPPQGTGADDGVDLQGGDAEAAAAAHDCQLGGTLSGSGSSGPREIVTSDRTPRVKRLGSLINASLAEAAGAVPSSAPPLGSWSPHPGAQPQHSLEALCGGAGDAANGATAQPAHSPQMDDNGDCGTSPWDVTAAQMGLVSGHDGGGYVPRAGAQAPAPQVASRSRRWQTRASALPPLPPITSGAEFLPSRPSSNLAPLDMSPPVPQQPQPQPLSRQINTSARAARDCKAMGVDGHQGPEVPRAEAAAERTEADEAPGIDSDLLRWRDGEPQSRVGRDSTGGFLGDLEPGPVEGASNSRGRRGSSGSGAGAVTAAGGGGPTAPLQPLPPSAAGAVAPDAAAVNVPAPPPARDEAAVASPQAAKKQAASHRAATAAAAATPQLRASPSGRRQSDAASCPPARREALPRSLSSAAQQATQQLAEVERRRQLRQQHEPQCQAHGKEQGAGTSGSRSGRASRDIASKAEAQSLEGKAAAAAAAADITDGRRFLPPALTPPPAVATATAATAAAALVQASAASGSSRGPASSSSSRYSGLAGLAGLEGLEDALGPLMEWRHVVEWCVDADDMAEEEEDEAEVDEEEDAMVRSEAGDGFGVEQADHSGLGGRGGGSTKLSTLQLHVQGLRHRRNAAGVHGSGSHNAVFGPTSTRGGGAARRTMDGGPPGRVGARSTVITGAGGGRHPPPGQPPPPPPGQQPQQPARRTTLDGQPLHMPLPLPLLPAFGLSGLLSGGAGSGLSALKRAATTITDKLGVGQAARGTTGAAAVGGASPLASTGADNNASSGDNAIAPGAAAAPAAAAAGGRFGLLRGQLQRHLTLTLPDGEEPPTAVRSPGSGGGAGGLPLRSPAGAVAAPMLRSSGSTPGGGTPGGAVVGRAGGSATDGVGHWAMGGGEEDGPPSNRSGGIGGGALTLESRRGTVAAAGQLLSRLGAAVTAAVKQLTPTHAQAPPQTPADPTPQQHGISATDPFKRTTSTGLATAEERPSGGSHRGTAAAAAAVLRRVLGGGGSTPPASPQGNTLPSSSPLGSVTRSSLSSHTKESKRGQQPGDASAAAHADANGGPGTGWSLGVADIETGLLADGGPPGDMGAAVSLGVRAATATAAFGRRIPRDTEPAAVALAPAPAPPPPSAASYASTTGAEAAAMAAVRASAAGHLPESGRVAGSLCLTPMWMRLAPYTVPAAAQHDDRGREWAQAGQVAPRPDVAEEAAAVALAAQGGVTVGHSRRFPKMDTDADADADADAYGEADPQVLLPPTGRAFGSVVMLPVAGSSSAWERVTSSTRRSTSLAGMAPPALLAMGSGRANTNTLSQSGGLSRSSMPRVSGMGGATAAGSGADGDGGGGAAGGAAGLLLGTTGHGTGSRLGFSALSINPGGPGWSRLSRHPTSNLDTTTNNLTAAAAAALATTTEPPSPALQGGYTMLSGYSQAGYSLAGYSNAGYSHGGGLVGGGGGLMLGDGRESNARQGLFPQVHTSNLAGMLRRNSVTGALAGLPPGVSAGGLGLGGLRSSFADLGGLMGGVGGVAGAEGVFGFLWRDLNAATSHMAAAAATYAADGALSAGMGVRAASGWLSSVATTVASALQLLYDRLSPGEVLLAHVAAGPRRSLGAGVGAAGEGSGHPAAPGTAAGTPSHAGGAGAAGASCGGGGVEPELVLRGLRVRVGLHSGPGEAEVVMEVVEGALVARYVGDFLAVAKEVSDSAIGGMVVLSGAAFRAYQQQLRRRERHGGGGGMGLREGVMVLHVGDHVIKEPHGGAAAGHDSTIANAFADAESSPVVSGARNISRTQRQSLSRTHSGCLQASPIIAAAPRAASMSRLGLSDAGCARELYAAVCPAMVARLALLPSPVRTHEEVALGCLSAPAGLVAPVFCNVHGVETLLAWEKVLQERFMRSTTPHIATPAAVTLQGYEGGADGRASAGGASSLAAARGGVHSSAAGPAAARACVVQVALAMLRDAATAAARRHGGYVVASSADGGHWVLVFGCAEAAVGWGLDMLQAMLTAEWPDGFLEHELTEEAWEGGRLVKRGLRLRIGVDFGRAMVRLVPRSGRLDYVGRPMNRAARIAAKAKAASLLVSDAAWSAARPTLGSGVAATNLGTMQLKGVKEQLELWALRACSAAEQPATHSGLAGAETQ